MIKVWHWFFVRVITTNYSLGQNGRDKIENLFLSEKIPLFPNQCCSQSFRLLTSLLIYVGEGENLKFEKLSYFLNLLDLQLLSRVAENFQNIKVNHSYRIAAIVGFYESIGW